MNKFLDKWGGWILAGFSSLGVVVTSVLSADEVPKAREAIEAAGEEQDLTFMDKCRIAAPICAPAFISGGLTIGGILTNQALNARQQASLIAAGAAGFTAITEYDKYRQAIRAEQGDAVDKRALERAKMTEEALRNEIERLRRENGPFLYAIATIPGLIFEARPADVHDAFMHFNRNLAIGGSNNLAELYEFIGIPMDYYSISETENYGWEDYANRVEWDCAYVDFDIEEVQAKDGTVVRLIDMPVPPYDLRIDYMDQHPDDIDPFNGHFYQKYDPIITKKYITDKDKILPYFVEEIDHPYLCRQGLW